jgi:Zn-dependent protease/predicted transcriptional regulator
VKSWSISVGRILGVEIRIHLSFVFLLLFIWVMEASNKTTNPWRGLLLAAIVFGSVVLHEVGHALVAAHSGLSARALILLPIGGISVFENSTDETSATPLPVWKREIRTALVGPFVNLLIAFVAGSVVLAIAPEVHLQTRPLVHSAHLLRSLVWVNVVLAAVNFLPAYPLDGGRILRALFTRRMEIVQATRRAVSIGQVFAVALMLVGFVTNVWLVVIGIFLFLATQLEERSVVFQSVLDSVRMEEVMLTDFVTLSSADTLEAALSKAVHSLQDDFPVIRGTDMVGVISRKRILQVLQSEGNGYVQAFMNRVYEVAQKGESLASAFRKLTSRGLTIIPVVDNQRLVGIVTLQNLMHSMSLLAESRKLRRESLD